MGLFIYMCKYVYLFRLSAGGISITVLTVLYLVVLSS